VGKICKGRKNGVDYCAAFKKLQKHKKTTAKMQKKNHTAA
jgi:hypothetical protein